jgi:hypothetical protein
MTWAELRDSAHALCRAFDPAVMSVADVAALLPTLTSLRRMLAAAEAQAAARVAESDRWRSSGARTPADHLARQLGTSVGEAARLLETGKRLGEQPLLRDAAVDGGLSPQQLHEIAATADAVADGDAEVAAETAQQLLEQVAAGSSLRELKRDCGNRRAAADKDPEATRRRIREQRSKRYWVDPDGTAHLQLRGPVEDFVSLELLIRDKREQIFQTNRRNRVHDKPDAVDYDAFHAVLSDLTQPMAAGTGAEPVKAGAGEAGAERSAGPRTGSSRYRGVKVIMRVDYEAVLRGTPSRRDLRDRRPRSRRTVVRLRPARRRGCARPGRHPRRHRPRRRSPRPRPCRRDAAHRLGEA